MPRGRGSGGGGGGGGSGGGGSGGRGSKSGHKGQRRHFTSPEALEAVKEKEERERQWRKQRGDVSEEEEEAENGEGGKAPKSGSDSEETESSSSEDEDPGKAKGIQHLIEVENPNRIVKKSKKVEHLTLDEANKTPASQLSRKEREELEKQKAKANYAKLHAAGKTDEARQDLARLALIRKQREDAAKKRDEDKKVAEKVKNEKKSETNKALGKAS